MSESIKKNLDIEKFILKKKEIAKEKLAKKEWTNDGFKFNLI